MPWRSSTALAGLLVVAPLLAWLFGLGRFATWFWLVAVPALLFLCVAGFASARRPSLARLHTALVVGTVGGLVGTAGYDIVRIPMAVVGIRLFAPIDSYGLLLLDARFSSPATGFAGWGYHVLNGVGFGIAYAAVALGRRWWWALAWAMVLETAAVLTPFASVYGLRGQWVSIALAYLAHVAYGVPLGVIVERHDHWRTTMAEVTSRPAVWLVTASILVLLVWHRPWTGGSGQVIDGTAAARVVNGRMRPEWIRIPAGGCVRLHDTAPAASRTLCFSDARVHRVKLSDAPYSGGFVIVDRELD